MQTLKLDDHNNLVVIQGSLAVVSDVEACAQDVKTGLGLCIGENPLNQQEGIDYDNTFLGKGGGESYVKNEVRNRILDHDEVISVESVTLQKQNDTLVLSTKINSIYGVFEL